MNRMLNKDWFVGEGPLSPEHARPGRTMLLLESSRAAVEEWFRDAPPGTVRILPYSEYLAERKRAEHTSLPKRLMNIGLGIFGK